jgi:hypothetical protein
MDGKSIADAVLGATKKWSKQRKAEERKTKSASSRWYAFTSSRNTVVEAADKYIEEAYKKASSNGAYPAHARQIMYACRGQIQEYTGELLGAQYFIQTVLVNYLANNPTKTADWDVVFDARGHFEEPHTELIVPLGTIDVRGYVRDTTKQQSLEVAAELGEALFPTCGPGNRYSAILFIEKEGFNPLFKVADLANRYDIAIMSTKGLSVTASRMLIDRLAGSHPNVPVLTLHDFDKTGFSILGTLTRSNHRYTFRNRVHTIDLGLRLADVEDARWNLEPEGVAQLSAEARSNLEENGATEAEIDFLIGDDDGSQRVELNAFSSGDLVAWIEEKLEENGIQKVIPDRDTLTAAYRRSATRKLLSQHIERLRPQILAAVEKLSVPDDLVELIRAELEERPEMPWDSVLDDIVTGNLPTGSDEVRHFQNEGR